MACGLFDRTYIASALTKPIPTECFIHHIYVVSPPYIGIDDHMWVFFSTMGAFGSMDF